MEMEDVQTAPFFHNLLLHISKKPGLCLTHNRVSRHSETLFHKSVFFYLPIFYVQSIRSLHDFDRIKMQITAFLLSKAEKKVILILNVICITIHLIKRDVICQ